MTGASFQLPGGTGLSFVGHTFSNWNSMPDGSGTAFNVDGTLQLSTSMTLYAQWDALLVSKSPNVLIGAVGSFAMNSATLTKNLKTQVLRLAVLTKTGHFTAETLYGYTNNSGSLASQIAISSRRATVVAAYLRAELRSMHVTGVTITSAGEGTVASESPTANRRVEVFVEG
jgi:outer membrane protein OmpA-like peptidoglycan-associated protein